MKKHILIFCFIVIAKLVFSQENKVYGSCEWTIYKGSTMVYQVGTSPIILGDTLELCPNDTFQLRLSLHGLYCVGYTQWKKNGTNVIGANSFTYTVRDTGVYTVNDSHYSSDFGPIKVIPCTAAGIKENINSDFKIFPNPVSDKLIIQQNTFENTTIHIFNSVGQLFLTKKIDIAREEIDLSFLESGVYYISLDNGKGIARQIIIKNAR